LESDPIGRIGFAAIAERITRFVIGIRGTTNSSQSTSNSTDMVSLERDEKIVKVSKLTDKGINEAGAVSLVEDPEWSTER
jgi:hypothetical protein